MKLSINAFVMLITESDHWVSGFDAECDLEKFVTLYDWFNEYQNLDLKCNEDIINHFLIE